MCSKLHTWVIPRAVPTNVDARKIFRNGTFFKNPLYSPTPTNEAIEVTSLTRPKNSGVKPSLFVLKPRKVLSTDEVDCDSEKQATKKDCF